MRAISEFGRACGRVAIVVIACCLLVPLARAAETAEVSIVQQYGLTYLPLYVMKEQKLIEKHAKAADLGEIKTTYTTVGSPAPINDAILADRAQLGAVGPPSLVTLWAKTKDSLGVKVAGSLTSMPMFLNTTNPAVKTLKDLTEKDRIAMPTVKVSVQGVTLQMAAAKELGDNRWSALDKQTVAMSHPDGMTALLSGASGITAHFTAPPFQYQELDAAKEAKPDGGPRPVHKVLSSYDVLGGKSTFVLVVSTEKFRKANPKTFDAMVKALSEAQKWINEHKKEAAELYLKASGSKEQLEDLLNQMNDPDIEFTVVPKNIGKYAEFMYHVGSVKARPETWKEMCFENLHGEEGS